MKIVSLTATTIPDAWFQTIRAIMDEGRKYRIDRGSFAGTQRLELTYYTVLIQYPYNANMREMLPDIPAAVGVPEPVTEDYIIDYCGYLMSTRLSPNEVYTYGDRLRGSGNDQIDYWIDALKRERGTNQAILQVARPDDYKLSDPPCLRHIALKVWDDALWFYPYFRSWDAWAGLPANLAGIAVLQNYMAYMIGIKVGGMIAASNGIHLYDYTWPLAEKRLGRLRVK